MLIDLNRTTGTITLGPASEGAGTNLETDMVDPQLLREPQHQSALEEQASQIAGAVWNPTQVDAVLQGWVNSASAEGSYAPTLQQQTAVTSQPSVHLAPAIISHSRSDRFLLKFFEGVLTNLRGGSALPGGIRKFVAEAEQVTRHEDFVSETVSNQDGAAAEIFSRSLPTLSSVEL